MGLRFWKATTSGLLSNQGDKSIEVYCRMVPKSNLGIKRVPFSVKGAYKDLNPTIKGIRAYSRS